MTSSTAPTAPKTPPASFDLDPDYLAWRNEQLAQYDRDYAVWRDAQARRHDEQYLAWRRDHGSRFDPAAAQALSRSISPKGNHHG